MDIEPYDSGVPVAGPNVPKIEQIDDLIRLLVTIRHRWGNTAVKYRVSWGGSEHWAADELRNVIRECAERIGCVDNGHCAVCRIAFRHFNGDGKPGRCENPECLSHRIDEAIGA